MSNIFKPLQEHNAILNINFVAGFVNDKKQWVEPSWTQQFVDEFGVKQDYASSKRGYDKGVKLGVFEVMCHGLTHMQPTHEWWAVFPSTQSLQQYSYFHKSISLIAENNLVF